MRPTTPFACRTLLHALLRAALVLAFVGGVYARESLHRGPGAEDLATLDRALAHGHFHGDPSELMRILHGHGAETVDHDQKPILARAPAPPAPRPSMRLRWRDVATGPRAPPAFALLRPPRA